jgi:hypothetical protein
MSSDDEDSVEKAWKRLRIAMGKGNSARLSKVRKVEKKSKFR